MVWNVRRRTERRNMRLNVSKYQELMNNQNMKKDDIERITGITVNTLDWIFENQYLEVSTLERLADAVKCDAKKIALEDLYGNENTIEWTRDSETAVLSLTQGRTITRVLKLAGEHPEKCKVIAMNKDGSVCVKIPTSWIRINPGMNLTDEQRNKMANRIRRNILKYDHSADETD